jgi:hypothetical protein
MSLIMLIPRHSWYVIALKLLVILIPTLFIGLIISIGKTEILHSLSFEARQEKAKPGKEKMFARPFPELFIAFISGGLISIALSYCIFNNCPFLDKGHKVAILLAIFIALSVFSIHRTVKLHHILKEMQGRKNL